MYINKTNIVLKSSVFILTLLLVHVPAQAINGVVEPNNHIYHSGQEGKQEWFQIDMGESFDLYRVTIFDRYDNSLHRFFGFQVRVGNTETTGKHI